MPCTTAVLYLAHSSLYMFKVVWYASFSTRPFKSREARAPGLNDISPTRPSSMSFVSSLPLAADRALTLCATQLQVRSQEGRPTNKDSTKDFKQNSNLGRKLFRPSSPKNEAAAAKNQIKVTFGTSLQTPKPASSRRAVTSSTSPRAASTSNASAQKSKITRAPLRKTRGNNSSGNAWWKASAVCLVSPRPLLATSARQRSSKRPAKTSPDSASVRAFASTKGAVNSMTSCGSPRRAWRQRSRVETAWLANSGASTKFWMSTHILSTRAWTSSKSGMSGKMPSKTSRGVPLFSKAFEKAQRNCAARPKRCAAARPAEASTKMPQWLAPRIFSVMSFSTVA
mmetsp:Transcript_49568/g.142110  ORF Transcript_49568/g.142110 Transcript_49568/m.142110 type:complete len:340 (-) Transcript_49568:1234-2253(-)